MKKDILAQARKNVRLDYIAKQMIKLTLALNILRKVIVVRKEHVDRV